MNRDFLFAVVALLFCILFVTGCIHASMGNM